MSKPQSKPKSKHQLKKLHKVNAQLQQLFITQCKNANWEEVKKFTIEHKSRLNLVVGVEWACHHSNLEMIKFLVDNGANIDDRRFTDFVSTITDVNIKTYLVCIRADLAGISNPLLHYWLVKCNPSEAKLCIQKGAIIPREYIKDYLEVATKSKNLEMIKLLLENIPNINVTTHQLNILTVALEKGDVEMCKKIIYRCSDLYVSNCLEIACEYNSMELVKYIFEIIPNLDIMSLVIDILSIVTERGNLILCKMLVEKGFDIHIRNENPLIMAIHGGHLEIIKYLVEKGANIHVNNNPPGKNNPLIKAIARSHLHIIEYLIDIGINIHITATEPLLTAVMSGNSSVVKCLVEKGADIHMRDESPLIFAIIDSYFDIVKYLVEYGADIYANDDEPMARALKGTNIEIVEYLLSQGGDLYLGDSKYLGKAIMSNNLVMTKFLFSNGAKIHILS